MPEKIDVDVLIIGGGPCGLGAAHRLQSESRDWCLLEAASIFGGLSASFLDEQGFTWDYGGHVLFSHFDVFDRYMEQALGDAWFNHERESWIWLKDRFIPYPFQNNLHRLDLEDRWQCVKGLLEVRQSLDEQELQHFGNWMRATMGAGITDLFMEPYNQKVWAYAPDKMDFNWIGERVAVPPLDQVLRSICLNEDNASWGPNNRFRFPEQGGTGAIWKQLGWQLPAERCMLNTPVVEIDPVARVAWAADGRSWSYRSLLSTMPLDQLIRMSGGWVQESVADQLRSSATHIVGVGMTGEPPEKLRSKCWMYFPEGNSPYYRTTVFSNYSCNNVAKPGQQWSLMTEISESPDKPVDAEQLIPDVLRAFKEDGLMRADEEVVSTVAVRVPYGYPTPFLHRDSIVDPVLKRFEEVGVYSRGRFGLWKYEVANMDHCFMQGYDCFAKRSL